jgi:hypothetical protein
MEFTIFILTDCSSKPSVDNPSSNFGKYAIVGFSYNELVSLSICQKEQGARRQEVYPQLLGTGVFLFVHRLVPLPNFFRTGDIYPRMGTSVRGFLRRRTLLKRRGLYPKAEGQKFK